MTLVSLQFTTQHFHLNLFEQSVTLNWIGSGNLFGRHLHVQCWYGVAILSQFGVAMMKRRRGVKPVVYEEAWTRGTIGTMFEARPCAK